MATDKDFVDYVRDQAADAGAISYRKMFGEYALYCDEKVVALVCDNQLFVKQTDAGRAVLGETTEGAPYSGAKPHFLIDQELDDAALIARLIRATANALPPPKPKKPRRKA